jgi:fructokinase
MTNVLGDEGIVASRIGNDELGREACRVMQGLGLNTSYLQQDNEHETGTAAVSIDLAGQPNFTIKELAAWDFLQWTAEWEDLSSRADVICFGSLAQRSPASAVAVESFLQNAPPKSLRIFDVNLRQSFYNQHVLSKSLRRAHIVKLNDQNYLRFPGCLTWASGLKKHSPSDCSTSMACCWFAYARGSGQHSGFRVSDGSACGFRVKIADAIGAGDAFTACLAHYYLRELSRRPQRTCQPLCVVGCDPEGCNSSISANQLQDILAGAIR